MLSLLLCNTLLLLSAISAASATTLGVTYNPSAPNLPPPERVVSTLQSLHVSAVRLLDPTPAAVRAFAYTNITLLLSVPNNLIPSFAANSSAASLWLHTHVLPYHPRTHISLISAGSDVITTTAISDSTTDPSTTLLPAMRNLHLSLLDLGIRTISVSTTFSFIDIMTTSFPPSSAEFQEPIGSLIIHPLLQFLEETNSSFLVNIYPYNVYRINSEIPIGFALFQEHPFNFRDDVTTGVRYRNLFDMMVDSVIAALAISGQENIPVIVAGTGWPSETEAQAAGNYAEMYLKGLLRHLRSGLGTPLMKEGVAEAYIYQLFDEADLRHNNDENGTIGAAASGGTGQHWGIMYPNMTMKYHVHFSGTTRVLENCKRLVEMALASLVSILLFL
ncbi:Glucan endo-1,3-beta-D-glucosidase [Handroanthus impetiginosus]|uniref:Glucan endo-1,3-beta-D-glucosidase n=1 Tax=Handroanthus impetiginosus TaxID=429701 RepID=A0A2G9GZ81_9LAMI|nr:Glucan endo-1,3-beta-D-glucosidase [Handroanthus impetiginosus]